MQVFVQPLLYLNFECEILLQILDYHNQKRQFDPQRLLRVGWTSDVGGADICSNNFQHQTLDIVVGDALYMAISHFFVPNLQRFAAYAVQY